MGPLAGILAITFATVGMLGKFYSESIESIDPKPVEALQATGSHSLGVIRHAVLPQVFPTFMGYNFYMLDSNIRSALALGIVGAGGLGIELYIQMEQFHFQKVATILIITIFLVALINRVSVYLRKGFIDGTLMQESRKTLDSLLIVAIPAIAIVCIFFTQVDLSMIPRGIANIVNLAGMFFPPNFTYLGDDVGLMLQTIAMGIAGTAFAIVLAVPLGMLAARNVTKNSVVHNVVRECLNFVRAMPEIMLALVFVAAVGLGPFAGVLALAIHTTGILGEFYAESIENIDPKPVEAVEATGARFTQQIRHAIIPQVAPIFNSHNLYILDRNIRASTIMGIVGAGGIGFELLESMRLYKYTHTAAIILIMLFTIFAVDMVSSYVRKKVV
jgi:phosphonate transport system permease protein